MASNQLLAAKERVQRYLTDLLGSIGIDSDGDFNFRHGSAQVFIRVAALGDDSTFVAVWAPTNVDVPVTPELYKYLADENQFRFGHMACYEKDGAATIVFRHSLLGEFLDPEELRVAVVLVAKTADEIDDQIKAKFGGRTIHES